MTKADSRLQRLARRRGVQTSYLDNLGRRQEISEESLRLILERLSVAQSGEGVRAIEPVIVRWQSARSKLRVRLPAAESGHANLLLEMEGGERESISLRQLTSKAATTLRAGNLAQIDLDIPDLPVGYHNLALETRSGVQSSLLISAPMKLYAESRRCWGGFLPLYAAHSECSWGAGNFSDWRDLSRWIGTLGGQVAGTLPVLAAFLDRPVCEPSPYSPASRFFWNEFYLDITALPEFQGSRTAQKLAGSAPMHRRLEKFRRSDYIDYKEEWAVRRKVLELLACEFFDRKTDRYSAFRNYLRDRPEVQDYARFRAACDAKQRPWHTWEAGARDGRLAAQDYQAGVRDFYLFIQWNAQQQMDSLLAESSSAGVKFYLDLPLGVNPDGFDAWRYREFFAQGVNAGAPPDSFFTRGQDWGFAPLDPRRTRELRYRYVIDYLRFQMRHTGLLRIDHVMGLHRLWWVPHGHPASAGAYVSYPAEELYAILSVESHRYKTMVVGENLGTVPAEVNKSMDRHGLRRMYVLQYEQQTEGALREPERPVVAGINTHDMPTFAAHWKGLDIEDRFDLGLIPRRKLGQEKRTRERLRKNLVRFLRERKLVSKGADSRETLAALLEFLARSPAETILVNLEDLWSEERSQNVPGTSTERPNWRRKAARTIEQMRADRELTELLTGLTNALSNADPMVPGLPVARAIRAKTPRQELHRVTPENT